MAGQTDLALILRGVGSLAAYEAGAIAGLYDGTYIARTISATGMGAVNAAIIAGNESHYVSTRLSAFWLDLAGWNVGDLNFLYDIVSQYVDFDRINREPPVHLRITLYRVKDGKSLVFDNTRTDISPSHIIASALPPPMMTMIGGTAFWGSVFSEFSSVPFGSEWGNASMDERLPVVEIIPDIEGNTDRDHPLSPEKAGERYYEVLLANSLDSASRAIIRKPGAERLCRIKIEVSSKFVIFCTLVWTDHEHLFHQAASSKIFKERKPLSGASI